MDRLKLLSCALLAAGVAAPAAAEKKDFAACDGYIAPSRTKDGLQAKGGLSPFSFQLPTAAKTRIKACTAALADPRLKPESWERRVTLLRARSLAHLQDGQPDLALADISEADKLATAAAAGEPFARGTGLGLKMVHAVALAQSGRLPESQHMATELSAKRPFGLIVQNVAAALMRFDPAANAADIHVAQRLARLDPKAGSAMIRLKLDAGDVDGAEAAFAATTPPPPPKHFVELLNNGLERQLGYSDLTLRLAFAQARRGNAAAVAALRDGEARRQEAMIAAMSKDSGLPDDLKLQDAKLTDALRKVFTDALGPWQRLIDAQQDLSEGDAAAAAALLNEGKLPVAHQTAALLEDVRKAAGPDVTLPDMTEQMAKLGSPADVARRIDYDLLFQALPEPENPERMVPYKKKGGWLSFTANGFKSKTTPAGDTEINYTGEYGSSVAVQEMTLLRAAEMAKANGKSAFLIVDRADYQRYTQMTMNGSPVGNRTPAGYHSSLTVRFVNPGDPALGKAEAARLIKVAEAEAALAGIYKSAD